jgi:antitoxin (DNA-binding transcriptional repressor) of toxin-antitoxin stability system
MERVTIEELRDHFDEYIERVRHGESFALCDGEAIVAHLDASEAAPIPIVRRARLPFSTLREVKGVPIAREPAISAREAFVRARGVRLASGADAVALLREDRDQR